MRQKHWVIFLFFFNLLLTTKYNVQSQNINIVDTLSWQEPFKTVVNGDYTFTSLSFSGAIYPFANSIIPLYSSKIKIPLNQIISEIKVKKLITVPLSTTELSILQTSKEKNKIDSFNLKTSIFSERKNSFLTINFTPIIKNKNKFEKVTQFEIEIILAPNPKGTKVRTYAPNSILASGKWYKFGVKNEGIHILKYQDIISMGLNPSTIDPSWISIFGNGGTPIPENNATPRPDDLNESAVFVSGGGDGKFDLNDYVLFYTKSPIGWSYNSTTQLFEYQNNIYSDYAYYFVTFDQSIGQKKRISSAPLVTDPYTINVTKYYRYFSYEKELTNLLKSGNDWLGEEFDVNTSLSFPFRISNLDLTEPLKTGINVASNATIAANFSVNIGGSSQIIPVPAASLSNEKAVGAYKLLSFTPTASSFNLNLSYIKPTTLAVGWLNNIVINAKCNLSQTESQIVFRNPETVGIGNIAKYNIANAITSTIWDVTDINNIKSVQTTIEGTNLTFVYLGDTLHEFVSFNGQSFYSPQYIGTVDNQNLHALPAADMIIITHPNYKSEAERLQEFHQNERGLTVHVVTTTQVYNEFACGSPDISAIRDFAKMLYDKYGSSFKYLLLFGDASYDFKNRLGYNQNFVPTYESTNSTDEYYSYSSDDYFALLDDNEGAECMGLLDIGVGRFVVKNNSEATQMVDKTIRYCSKINLTKTNPDQISNLGDWKNTITIIADDDDGNTHLSTAIKLSTILELNYPKFNIEKIFLDAFQQTSNSGGQRYPDVEVAINERMRKGTLLMNYVGHGGEVGWAHERILRISDIEAWQNKYNMPIMLTATCEFTRYDDPARVSAGELVFLNTNGGAAALFTTSRIAWSGTNEFLCINFYNNAFQQLNGKYSTLGI
jgi:hypothetical protein